MRALLSLQSSLCHASQTLHYSCYDQTWARREKTFASMATNAMTFLRVKMENVMGMSSDSIEIYPPSESRDQPNSQMRRNWSSIVLGEQSRFCRSSDPTSNSIAAAPQMDRHIHPPPAPPLCMRYSNSLVLLVINEFLIYFLNFGLFCLRA